MAVFLPPINGRYFVLNELNIVVAEQRVRDQVFFGGFYRSEHIRYATRHQHLFLFAHQDDLLVPGYRRRQLVPSPIAAALPPTTTTSACTILSSISRARLHGRDQQSTPRHCRHAAGAVSIGDTSDACLTGCDWAFSLGKHELHKILGGASPITSCRRAERCAHK